MDDQPVVAWTWRIGVVDPICCPPLPLDLTVEIEELQRLIEDVEPPRIVRGDMDGVSGGQLADLHARSLRRLQRPSG